MPFPIIPGIVAAGWRKSPSTNMPLFPAYALSAALILAPPRPGTPTGCAVSAFLATVKEAPKPDYRVSKIYFLALLRNEV